MNTTTLESLSNSMIVAATKRLGENSRLAMGQLLRYLGEFDQRRLYLDLAFSSTLSFCMEELHFSEDEAFTRVAAARLVRRFPAALEAYESGQVHLTGLRIISSHLTQENHVALLLELAGKSKRSIEEVVARLAPKPPVPDSIRPVPQRKDTPVPPASIPDFWPIASPSPISVSTSENGAQLAPPEPPPPASPQPRAVAYLKPLTEETFKIEFTASKSFRDKFRRLQALLSHSVPAGSLAELFEKAMDVTITEVEKKRYGVGRKPQAKSAPRPKAAAAPARNASRHIPDSMKREIHQRDDGQCTFVSPDGRRCGETRRLEFDHLDGFARTHAHEVNRIALRCRNHNQHGAEKMYGKEFMQKARHRFQNPMKTSEGLGRRSGTEASRTG